MLPKLILVIIILASITAIGIFVAKPQKPVPLPIPIATPTQLLQPTSNPILTSLQELTVSTDKAVYNLGEPISIKIKNSLKQSIYLHKSDLGIESLEKKKEKGIWDQLAVGCKYPDCIYDTDSPSELKSGEKASFLWKPKESQVNTGIYRLNISYQLRVGSSSQSWSWQTAMSNEFSIK